MQVQSNDQLSSGKEQKPPKLRFFTLFLVLLEIWHQRLTDGVVFASSSIIKKLRATGTPEEDLSSLLMLIANTHRKKPEANEAPGTERYLAGVMGILLFLLFQALVTPGNRDTSLTVAWIGFCVCLPSTCGFLFLITQPGKEEKREQRGIPIGLAIIALCSEAFTFEALIWHSWWVASLLVLVAAAPVTIVCLLYTTMLRVRRHFTDLTKNMTPTFPDQGNTSTPTDALQGESS